MRLLHVDDDGRLSLATFYGDKIPPYAILSHTWGPDEDEVSYEEFRSQSDAVQAGLRKRPGYRKLNFCSLQVSRDGLHYFWVDTCCINKQSDPELTEAINSMFRWYQRAAKCYVYLSDHVVGNGWSSFSRSRWFTRGWTLQELLAPLSVEFYDANGDYLGEKATLAARIKSTTGISENALHGQPLHTFSIKDRLSWGRDRRTKREEDGAYAMLGIFGVTMPLVYGEGSSSAYYRLLNEVETKAQREISPEYTDYLPASATALKIALTTIQRPELPNPTSSFKPVSRKWETTETTSDQDTAATLQVPEPSLPKEQEFIAPREVQKRVEIQPVQHQRALFWDLQPPRASMKTRKGIMHAMKRAKYLEEFKLLYEYKKIKADEMRLLFVYPAKRLEMDIVVSIEEFRDCDTGQGLEQEYEALSYHWGPGPADKPVYIATQEKLSRFHISSLARLQESIPDYKQGKRMYVRSNLDKALRYLRDKEAVVILWVDTMCINQVDEKIEKPTQVAKINNVFNKASNVCIWLGDGKVDGKPDRSKDFYAAMDFSREFIRLDQLERYLEDPQSTKSWSYFLDLIRSSWFSRRWVIQEVALAREASVHCGNKSVRWQDFADAIGIFAQNVGRIRALFEKSREDAIYRKYKSFDELAPFGAKILVNAVTNAVRRGTDGCIVEPVWDLETLVTNLCSFESSDPRDTIIALLNIARESSSFQNFGQNAIKPPLPKYGCHVLEVYTDFLEWVIYTTDSIDIICRHWATPERERVRRRNNPTSLTTLPSWIQTVNNSPWGFHGQEFDGRINGDSIVGIAGRRRYNASNWKKPEVCFGTRLPIGSNARAAHVQPVPLDLSRGTYSYVLEYSPRGSQLQPEPSHFFVKGIEIGTVEWAYGPVSKGVIPKECLEKGDWKNNGIGMSKVPDRLWRTLVADRNADGENSPSWYHRAAWTCMFLVNSSGDIATHELLNPPHTAYMQAQIVQEYLKRMQAVCWNRKFIEARPCPGTPDLDVKSMGMPVLELEPDFGLAPPATESGDRVCILFGCTVPCILRPVNDGTGHYTFVGEAYIYGKMDGEAIATMKGSELLKVTKEFVID